VATVYPRANHVTAFSEVYSLQITAQTTKMTAPAMASCHYYVIMLSTHSVTCLTRW